MNWRSWLASRGMRAAARFGRVLVAASAVAGVALVLVVARPAAATTVSDEAAFRAAWTNAAETQITLTADITLTLCGSGVPTRNSATALTVTGNGHTIHQTCAGQGVLQQDGTGALTFDGTTITGGDTAGNGGGIFTSGSVLTLTNSTVSDNSAAGVGGGIFIGLGGGGLTLTNSTLSGNTSAAGGGGSFGSAPVTLTNSTVSDNHVTGGGGGGGGIAAGSTVTLTNSTVSGNTASLNGGGISAPNDSVTVTNSTVSGNTAAGIGGGILGGSGPVTLVYATVVGNSSAAFGANVDGQGFASLTSFASVVALPVGGGSNCAQLTATTSNGFNFSDDSSCGFTAGTDRQNAGDAGLGALANNGGPTQTRLLQTGSPLLDAVPLASCHADGAAGITTDQRGLPRPAASGCDVGAVEVQPPTPVVVSRFTG